MCMRATAFTLSCMLEAMNSSLLAMDMLNYKSLCMRSFVSAVSQLSGFSLLCLLQTVSHLPLETMS